MTRRRPGRSRKPGYDRGRRVRAVRDRLEIPVAECAAQVGVTGSTWMRWEVGDTQMPDARLKVWCEANNLSYPPW